MEIKYLPMWTWPIQKPLEYYVYKNVSLLVHVCASWDYGYGRWHILIMKTLEIQ